MAARNLLLLNRAQLQRAIRARRWFPDVELCQHIISALAVHPFHHVRLASPLPVSFTSFQRLHRDWIVDSVKSQFPCIIGVEALKLNCRTGEKIQDIVWPKTIEIKGRVKWGVFKKFLKDLRHSQNRSIMVISLLLNVESSKNGLEGMKQVAKMLKVNKRIGLSTTEDGSYIYNVKASFISFRLVQEVKASLPIALEYFRPLTDHGNNNGISPGQQHWMFSEWLETDYVIAGSQHLRPPSGSALGHLWHRMSCARSGNNLPGFERSEGFSGSSSTYYSRFENGSGSMPPN
uniref:Spen paralogue and orthologue SPOC C-terminal domain-containing protein n=1 Tax=Aegilops tauschii TaxID=37682 RepID=M8CQZ8_AEGTA